MKLVYVNDEPFQGFHIKKYWMDNKKGDVYEYKVTHYWAKTFILLNIFIFSYFWLHLSWLTVESHHYAAVDLVGDVFFYFSHKNVCEK